MSSYKTQVEIKAFLWNKNVAQKNDKIWGYATVSDKIYCFWGRRGTGDKGLKSVQFKLEIVESKLRTLSANKCRKGYVEQSLENFNGEYPAIDLVYPGFVAHMRNELMMAKLAGNVRREGDYNVE